MDMTNERIYEFCLNSEVPTKRFAKKLQEVGDPLAGEFLALAAMFNEIGERARSRP